MAGEEITQEDVRHSYPNWVTWRGTDELFHGRRTRGAALAARGESWQDLLGSIRRQEAWLWAPGNALSRYWQK